jgi:transposase
MLLHGEVEFDESYCGGRRKRKRGRGVAGKFPVFGLLKCGGKVFAKVIPDTKSTTLMGIMQEKFVPDSIVYTDCYRSYNVLDISTLPILCWHVFARQEDKSVRHLSHS